MEKMIPTVPNPSQDSHNPSFVVEIAEDEKIVGDEFVHTLHVPPSPPTAVNDDHRVESPHSPYSPYVEWEWKACVYKSSMTILVNMWMIIRMIQR